MLAELAEGGVGVAGEQAVGRIVDEAEVDVTAPEGLGKRLEGHPAGRERVHDPGSSDVALGVGVVGRGVQDPEPAQPVHERAVDTGSVRDLCSRRCPSPQTTFRSRPVSTS